ncbi:MAG: hypothetical protein ACOY94_02395 [Bacillota bacterium]
MRRRRRGLRRTLDPPRLRRRSAPRGQGGPRGGRSPWSWLGASALLFLLSLGAVARVSAMPAEARTQETWFAYQQEMRYDFTARVKPGPIYSQDLVGAEDLVQQRLPVEPPAYRRVLVGPLAETLRITLPYHFRADRKAPIRATYQIDGEIRVPNLWRRQHQFLAPRTVTVEAAELRLNDLAVDIPVREIIAEVRAFSQELKIPHDQIEVRVRPTVQVEVEGQREPVSAKLAPELMVLVRSGGIGVEVDEPRTVTDSQQFETNERVPLSVNLWGWTVPVALLRQVAYVALGLFALLVGAGLAARWLQHRRSGAPDLAKLGSGLIRASDFTLPAGVALVDVPHPEQLIHLHLQTERPVLQVGGSYYLLDGSTCYRHGRRSPAIQAAAAKEPEE